jgi:hypothetical protein
VRELVAARVGAGDAAALEGYASWIASASPELVFGDSPRTFAPFWSNPEDASVVRAATAMFGADQHVWLPAPPSVPPFNVIELAHTALVRVAPFRAALLRGLGDRRVVGTFRRTDQRSYEIVSANGTSGGGFDPDVTPRPPRQGVRMPLRMCDLWAIDLARAHDAPAYQPYWPLPLRDAAIAALIAFVQRESGLRTPVAEED